VRFMAAPSLSIVLDVYDASDTLLNTYTMNEVISGIYRADVPVSSNDMWAVIREINGENITIVRIQPSMQSNSIMLDDVHITVANDLIIDAANGTITAKRGTDNIDFDLLNNDDTKAYSPNSAAKRIRK